MALPLIPFAAGMAVGSLATYGMTDKALHERVAHLAQDVYAKLSDTTSQVVALIPGVGKKSVDLSEATETVAEAAEDVAQEASSAAEAVVKEVKKTTRKRASATTA